MRTGLHSFKYFKFTQQVCKLDTATPLHWRRNWVRAAPTGFVPSNFRLDSDNGRHQQETEEEEEDEVWYLLPGSLHKGSLQLLERALSPELPSLDSGNYPSLYCLRHRGWSPEILHYPLLDFLNSAYPFLIIPLINFLQVSQLECAICYLLGPRLRHTPGHHLYSRWVKTFSIYLQRKQIKES